jgi:hypothetical protein
MSSRERFHRAIALSKQQGKIDRENKTLLNKISNLQTCPNGVMGLKKTLNENS